MAVKYHKGIAYFSTLEEAREIRDMYREAYPEARIVSYEIGFAMQYRKSGPYFPEHEDSQDESA